MAKLKEEIRGLQELLEKRDTAIVQHEVTNKCNTPKKTLTKLVRNRALF